LRGLASSPPLPRSASVQLAGRALVLGYDVAGVRREVIGGLDCELRRGRLVALLGPNGAGKSTLLKTLAGLLPPLGGEIQLAGRPLAAMAPEERARQVAVVFTERFTAPHLLASELVALGRHPHTGWHGRLSPTDRDAVLEALDAVGAAALAMRNVDELSDGELQRVAIARALAQEAEILLLDEATAYLDLPRRVETFELLRRLAHQEGKSILISTHDLDLALRSADELWLLAPAGSSPAAMFRGAPEELALAGTFGQVFASPEVRFDLDSGAFRFDRRRRGRLAVELPQGLGERARREGIWLLRALERLGFELAPEGGGGDRLSCLPAAGGGLDFVLKRNGAERRFGRLGELIEELEES
jgi:iron complex transport system ATP-binding protein